MSLFIVANKKESTEVLSSASIPSATLKDEELVTKFVNGDRAAFDLLVMRFKKKVYNFIYFQIHQNASDAEDLSQEVFIELYKKASGFRGDSKFPTFLFAIARNLVLNYFRSNRRSYYNETVPLSEDIVDAHCPSQDVINGRLKQQIVNTLNELNIEERQIIYLCDNENFTYHQISEILSIKIGTVRSRINSARTRLLNKLKEQCNEVQ